MNRNWTDVYYDACTFYSWEPQHLRKPPRKSPSEDREALLRKTLKRKEVPLNHVLDFLFMLGAERLVIEIVAEAIGEKWSDTFYLAGRNHEERYSLPVNSVQTDFTFEGNEHLISMEMKVGAKTDSIQLAKYLYFHAIAERLGERPRRHALIYLGPGSWSTLWRDKRDLSYEARLEEAVQNAPEKIGRDQQRVDVAELKKMAAQIKLGYLSYGQLAEILKSVAEDVDRQSWEGGVAIRLLDGVIGDLQERELIYGSGVK
ncbi:MAG: hypothetical protein D6773_06375 [Alphaproteobacteria bacterium]|nr:MAG: hypothetical protein D6773_06375 [Alphaproteobacteria bacterium]